MITRRKPTPLTWDRWVSIVSRVHPPGEEQVLMIRRLKRPFRLFIPKGDMKRCFGDCDGIRLKEREPILVETLPTGSRTIDLPDQVVSRLRLRSEDIVCITRDRDTRRCFLKRFEIVFAESEVPGQIVVDTLRDTTVKRICYSNPDFKAIVPAELISVAGKFGRLRHNPMVPLKRAKGRIGFLFRKHFMGENTASDRAFRQDCTETILASQHENGSWDNNLVATAYNLVRLAEIGLTCKNAAVEKASRWLLSTPEPIGLPGLFMATVALTEDYNTWKSNPECKDIPIYRAVNRTRSKRYAPAREPYEVHWEVVPGICEQAVTSSSAVVLQALFRLGLADKRRVKKATNTLLSVWGGRWCGCGLLFPHTNISASAAEIDFNTRFPLPCDNETIYRGDWFPDEKKLVEMTAARKTSPHYDWLNIGKSRTLIDKRSVGMGDCTLGVHDALSYHPRYAGSKLETIAAVEFVRRQSACGRWGDTSLLRIFHSLARLSHPLAAFLVLRSIPMLIREQRSDGLWSDERSQPPRRRAGISAIYWNSPDEILTFAILRALDRFGFLASLLPAGGHDA